MEETIFNMDIEADFELVRTKTALDTPSVDGSVERWSSDGKKGMSGQWMDLSPRFNVLKKTTQDATTSLSS